MFSCRVVSSAVFQLSYWKMEALLIKREGGALWAVMDWVSFWMPVMSDKSADMVSADIPFLVSSSERVRMSLLLLW